MSGVGFLSEQAAGNATVQALDLYSSVFGSSVGTSAAGGGFVQYPNKTNTNMMQQVYSK